MIEKTVVLPCRPAKAFELFTTRVSDWWPPERRHTQDPHARMFLLATGRFFEQASNGVEVELGRVRVWEPPSRLVLDFYPGTDAAHPTEVEVLFQVEEGASHRTRVTVFHRATAASASLFHMRASAYVASWDLVLPAFERAATALGEA